jgi:hypothetical protein
LNPIVYGLFAFLAFLFPVAVYFLALAVINGRRRPTVISGPWDFVGVLFATSGFLLVGGPWILTNLNTEWRNLLLQGRFGGLNGQSSQWWYVWIGVWIVYFAAVVAGAVYLLRRRRLVTVIYNAEPAIVEEALAQTLDRLGLEGGLVGTRLHIGMRVRGGSESAEESLAPSDSTSDPGLPSAGSFRSGEAVPTAFTAELPASSPVFDVGRTAVVELDPFLSVHHMTLRWQTPTAEDRLLRRDVEAELAKVLAEVQSTPNPATGWFLTISSCLFLLMLVGLALLILVESRRG